MSVADNINNLKEIGLYGFNSDGESNIEITFHIEEPGDYKLMIKEKELNSMKRWSGMDKLKKTHNL